RGLSGRHRVRRANVHAQSADEAIAAETSQPPADLYLLKAHGMEALSVAQELEKRGARVVNSWVSSAACQDRVLMALWLQQAGLPAPRTWSVAAQESALAEPGSGRWPFPFMIKSRYSFRGD